MAVHRHARLAVVAAGGFWPMPRALRMRILVNGIEIEMSGSATVFDAAACVGIHRGDRGVAAALDGEVVPSGRWHKTPIYEGARIEVVRAAAGG